jgi:hypothetical protein
MKRIERSAARILAAAVALLVHAGLRAESLRAPADFAAIADPAARSAAIFQEAGKVIQSPRCLNCHPNGRVPTQGENLHTHVPYLDAASSGMGKPGIKCVACHQAANVRTPGLSIRSIPGHPHWHLAPASMAWQGKSLEEICVQIKDPARNGGFDLAKLHHHMADDPLVGWAWHPGEGRKPAPGTQQLFGQLIQAWIATGAACPAGASTASR